MKKFKKYFQAQDMTQGKPWKAILMFSIPMIIGNFAQQLYSTVDSMVVGKYIGDLALSSVGASTPILFILGVLFIGLATGIGIMVSQYFGAKQGENLSYTIGNAIVLTGIISVFTMIISYVFLEKVLRLVNTPAHILQGAMIYLKIIIMGMPAIAYYNILAGILRGLGDSISALMILFVSTVMNIVLDILFVAKFHIGIAGVAWATVIAQFVSAILCFVKLNRMKNVFVLDRKAYLLKGNLVEKIVRLGLPSGATQAVFSLSGIVVQSLVNQFGDMFIAASLMVMRVDGFAMLPNFSFGVAMTTYAGQNVGARKMERLKQGKKEGIILAVTVSFVMTLVILIFGKHLMYLFSNTEALVSYSWKMMFILAPGYLVFAVTQCLGGMMRGAGDTVTPLWISIISTALIRVPLAYGLAYLTRSVENPLGKPEMIFVSLSITWLLGCLMHVVAYRRGKWMKKSIHDLEN